jgi:hypothetical protein
MARFVYNYTKTSLGAFMRLLIVALALFTSISTVRANDVGCGLGSMIWKDNSIISALFAITTNHSFSSQLFGITTGTSGCSQHSIVKREMYPVYYAEANLPELRHEMAMGQGEYLTTFAQVLGCKPESQIQFKATSLSASCDNLALI